MATEIVTPLAPEAQQQAFLPFSARGSETKRKNEVLQTLDSDWITTGRAPRRLKQNLPIISARARRWRSVRVLLPCTWRWQQSVWARETQLY